MFEKRIPSQTENDMISKFRLGRFQTGENVSFENKNKKGKLLACAHW